MDKTEKLSLWKLLIQSRYGNATKRWQMNLASLQKISINGVVMEPDRGENISTITQNVYLDYFLK